MLLPGDKLPEFSIKDIYNNIHESRAYMGIWTLFFIYSVTSNSNNAKNCKDLTLIQEKLSQFHVRIILISDGTKEQQKPWALENKIYLPIIPDHKLELIRSFGSWQPITINTKTYMGVQNTIVLSDPHLTIRVIKELREESIIQLTLSALRHTGIPVPIDIPLETNQTVSVASTQSDDVNDDDSVLFE